MIIRIDTYSSLKDKGFLSIKTNEYYFCNHLKLQDSKHRIQKKPSFACKIIKSSFFNFQGCLKLKDCIKLHFFFYHIVISHNANKLSYNKKDTKCSYDQLLPEKSEQIYIHISNICFSMVVAILASQEYIKVVNCLQQGKHRK